MTGRPTKEWSFSYQDLCDLTGLKGNTIQQHVKRGKFDPENLESLFVWLCKHAKPTMRIRMVSQLLNLELPEPPSERRQAKRKRR